LLVAGYCRLIAPVESFRKCPAALATSDQEPATPSGSERRISGTLAVLRTPQMLPPQSQFEEAALAEPKEKVEEPPLFKVLLHNDDFTTMEFVVWILESVFNMPEEQAIQVMLNVHLRGLGVAGIYTYEIAETKVEKTTALAREHEFPLLVTMEEA
jgi:ATP-dependent Clp protease adaptor protein ClpS